MGGAEELLVLQRGPSGLDFSVETKGFPSAVGKRHEVINRAPSLKISQYIVPRGVRLREIYCWKLLSSSVIFKSMYFPRNRVAPFKSHRCPQALLGRLLQVSFNTHLRPGGKLFSSSLWKWIFFPFYFPFQHLPSCGKGLASQEMRNGQEWSLSPSTVISYLPQMCRNI